MEYAKLGRTNIKISKIGIGTWQWGTSSWGWGSNYSTEDLKKAFDLAIDLGINFFDTAEIYGSGKSEELLGEFVNGRRAEVVIASKVFAHHLKYKSVIKACKKSLERLNTSYIDLYQVHWPNPLIPMRSTAKAMDYLLKNGLIKAVGVSNFNLNRMIRFNEVLESDLASNQVKYSMLHRDPEQKLLPYALEHEITVIAYSPLDQGLISGKYTEKNLPKDLVRRATLKFTPINVRRAKPIIDLVSELAEKHDVKPVNIALRYLVDKGAVPIVGIKRPSHVKDLVLTFEFNLSPTEIDRIHSTLNKIRFAKLVAIPYMLKRLIAP